MNNLLQVARQAIKAVPDVVQYLSEATKAELLGYPPIRANYWAEIYDSVEQYLTGNKPVTSFRNKASIAVSEAFTDAVYEGYAQAGAELPLSDDVAAWLSQRIAEERGHIESMFDRLKQEWEGLDWIKEAYARADAYSRTLDAMYSEAQLRGMKNQMVTWILGDTEEHCDTCATLAGNKHRISYLIANNYIPRKPDCGLSCRGYRCDCKIIDKNGKEVTIGETKAMKGGEGSGNFGHAGRPGEVGGSAADGDGGSMRLSKESVGRYGSAKEYIKKEFREVYHHSDKEIEKFGVGREAWFTTNKYGYSRRSGSNVVNTRYINVNGIKWASQRDMGPFMGQGRDVIFRELSSMGFEGIKLSVDGDTHYAIFNPDDIHTRTELESFYESNK